MLLTNATQRIERIEICKLCPVYNQSTTSCGTFLNKLNPFNEPVELDGVTFRPCGCNIRAKASLKISQCPAGRWPVILSEKDRAKLLDIIEIAEKTRTMHKADIDMVNEILQKIDPNYKLTIGCSDCVARDYHYIKEALTFGTIIQQPSKLPSRIVRAQKSVVNKKKKGKE
jgi:hypothetical protein